MRFKNTSALLKEGENLEAACRAYLARTSQTLYAKLDKPAVVEAFCVECGRGPMACSRPGKPVYCSDICRDTGEGE